jgi:hypothetical protein
MVLAMVHGKPPKNAPFSLSFPFCFNQPLSQLRRSVLFLSRSLSGVTSEKP